jgi:hypothetical protein
MCNTFLEFGRMWLQDLLVDFEECFEFRRQSAPHKALRAEI